MNMSYSKTLENSVKEKNDKKCTNPEEILRLLECLWLVKPIFLFIKSASEFVSEFVSAFERD